MSVDAAYGVQSSERSYSFKNGELGSGDFMRLMIEELTHQDPLNPMKNEELLNQISQIKNMETLTRLDGTLTSMTYQQKVATAGALIGKTVSGINQDDEQVTGTVVKVTAGSKAGVTLVTDAGDEIAIDNVTAIVEAQQ